MFIEERLGKPKYERAQRFATAFKFGSVQPVRIMPNAINGKEGPK